MRNALAVGISQTATILTAVNDRAACYSVLVIFIRACACSEAQDKPLQVIAERRFGSLGGRFFAIKLELQPSCNNDIILISANR